MPSVGTGAPPRRANPAQLHLFLGIGLVVTAAALGVTRYLTSGLAPDPASLITFIMAGVSVSMAGAALMFLAALLALFVIATFWMNGPRAFDRE